jgi:hypothetical protein
MRRQEPLQLLRQVKEAALQRLKQESALAETELRFCESRYAEKRAEVETLVAKRDAERLVVKNEQNGGRTISVLNQQTQYRYTQLLSENLRVAQHDLTVLRTQLDGMKTRVLELKNRLCVAVGQKEGLNAIANNEERREVLRCERDSEDALTEQWLTRVR